MILPDRELIKWAVGGGVSPYRREQVNPASIDLRLGDKICTPRWYWRPGLWRTAHKLGLPKWSKPRRFVVHLLPPGGFVLCHSLEHTVVPDDCLATLFLKSSVGRTGIEHLHAGLGDSGFAGEWTWELQNVAPWPVELVAGSCIMQLVLTRLESRPFELYQGRYQGQTGPTVAKV